jgi:probable F420-dependent oxidoreductase
MKLWLAAAFVPLHRLPQLAAAAADAGFDGMAVPEHTVVPDVIASPYPYSRDKQGHIPADAEFGDPLTAIASLAVSEPRLAYAAHVLLPALRHPILLAKQTATVAALTDCRLELGVGNGWVREEYQAHQIDFDRRADRLVDAVTALRKLWSGELVAHRGPFYSFDAVAVNPVPPTTPKVIIVGESDESVERAALIGDGWSSLNASVTEIANRVLKLKTIREELGLGLDGMEIRAGLRGKVTGEQVAGLGVLGVTSLVIAPWQVVRATDVHRIPFAALVDSLPSAVRLIRQSWAA